jgi:hypothetical protein
MELGELQFEIDELLLGQLRRSVDVRDNLGIAAPLSPEMREPFPIRTVVGRKVAELVDEVLLTGNASGIQYNQHEFFDGPRHLSLLKRSNVILHEMTFASMDTGQKL